MDQELLPRIGSPADLAGLNQEELKALCAELRGRIVRTVSRNGGHLASNLGVVELTVALHRVFSTPKDMIVWDVGHQCYTHKLLTGRAAAFEGIRRSGGISGFPKRAESIHDAFDTGHSSTSISAALGLLAAERLQGGSGCAVAVIGDGALTGGMAFEGLSHAGQLGLPLVVVLNDNKMSIGPNVGALSEYLSRLTMTAPYQSFRRNVDRLVRRIPLVGPSLYQMIVRMKKGIKAVFYPENFFLDLGFEYVGPIDGHQIGLLEQVLRDAKELKRPVVVHVTTRKGKGYGYAEENPSLFHGVSPFSVNDGSLERRGSATFTEAFASALLSVAREDGRIVAITAAMEKGTGLSPFRTEFPKRFFDVGIAEQHAVTFSAGLAARGLRPVTALYSTFSQRAIDQILHDVAIQDLPLVLALDRAGFVSDDGETHQGLFDVPFLRAIPNMALLSPASGGELSLLLRWALGRDRPVALRYPKAACPHEVSPFSEPVIEGRGVFLRRIDSPILIAFSGGLYPYAAEAADILLGEGVSADLYNLRFLKPVDEDYFCSICSSYTQVVLVEDCVRSGGFGEWVAGLLARRNLKTRLTLLGAPDSFPSQATRDELISASGLDGRGIAASILDTYREPGRLTVLRQTAL